MVDTRSRQQTLLDRFEELDAIWPERAVSNRMATASLGSDDLLEVDGRRAGEFLFRHRWGLIALATITAVVAWVLLVAAPAIDARYAAQTVDDYDEVLVAIDGAVPSARRALTVLADPVSDDADLSVSLDHLAPFVTAAGTGRSVVAAPLPGTPPFVPRTDIEAVTPIRVEVEAVVANAEMLATRLNSLLTYRLLADDLFTLPELPLAADPDAADAVSVELAGALAAAVEATVSLPSDPLLAEHRLAATDTLTLLETFRADYLTALRAEDAEATEALIADIELAMGALSQALHRSLAGIEEWGARQLDLLRVATIEARRLTG